MLTGLARQSITCFAGTLVTPGKNRTQARALKAAAVSMLKLLGISDGLVEESLQAPEPAAQYLMTPWLAERYSSHGETGSAILRFKR